MDPQIQSRQLHYNLQPSSSLLFLSQNQLLSFHRDGFLVIPDFFSKPQAATLLSHAHSLLHSFDLQTHPLTKFTSDDQNHVGDDYFLDSGDKIRFFFEEDAFDKQSQKLLFPPHEAINKIGHGLHQLDPIFHPFSTQPRLQDLARDIGFKDPRVLQSMVICKQPRIGGEVRPHQDAAFLYTRPTSAVGFWFAMEDCTKDNGCMWFVPGSHRGKIAKRFVRNPNGKGTVFMATGDSSIEPAESEYICTETPAGSLVLIHGHVFHKSSHNHSEKSRFIYTFHMIEGSFEYPEDNWLQPSKDVPFMKLLEQKQQH